MKKLVFILLFVGGLLLVDGVDISAADFQISIDKLQDVKQGRTVDFSIRLDSTQAIAQEMGGFDLLIRWNPSAMTLVSVDTGMLLNKCGWEYFMYKYASNSPCGDTVCPSGVLRLIAIADLNDGPFNHPDCFGGFSGELASVTVMVSPDTAFACRFIPIQFLWFDCGDNTITSVSGTHLFLSDEVWDMGVNIAGQTNEWSYFGALEECLTTGTTNPPTRNVDFINGGIDIACIDSFDVRIGDINLNGTANEIADNQLFLSYFLHGPTVFTIDNNAQIFTTDLNRDSTVLGIDDFVYQTRLIHGQLTVPENWLADTVEILYNAEQRTISQVYDGQLGALLFIFLGEISNPILYAPGMTLDWQYDGTTTVVVISSIIDGNACEQGDLLSWSGGGQLLHATSATWSGGKTYTIRLMPTDIDESETAHIPDLPDLYQNYPNPFNNSTLISFNLNRPSNITIEVIDILGRTIWTESRKFEPGTHSIDWPGVNQSGNEVSSGIYFYRLTSDNFVQTKKMMLVK